MDPEVFAVVNYDGRERLFFFLNSEVRARFLEEPAKYVAAGDKRWAEFYSNSSQALRNTMCYRCGDAGLSRSCT